MTLESAMTAHYADPPADSPEQHRRRLEARAHLFAPSQELEAAVAHREADPERHDAELRAMGGDLVAEALAMDARAAAIELGTFTPKESIK